MSKTVDPNTRRCPILGCTRNIPPERFACYRHWQMLCGAERARVWEIYRKWQMGEIDGETLQAEQRRVIDAVEARERSAAG